MKAYFTRRRHKGNAAIELALILVFTSFILPVVFLFARVFYHYNVIKQATQDAASAMASTPRIELVTFGGMAAAKARSSQIVMDAIASAGIKPPETLIIDVTCNGNPCVAATPVVEIQVYASFSLFDGFWRDTMPWLTDPYGPSWTFSATSDAPYQN